MDLYKLISRFGRLLSLNSYPKYHYFRNMWISGRTGVYLTSPQSHGQDLNTCCFFLPKRCWTCAAQAPGSGKKRHFSQRHTRRHSPPLKAPVGAHSSPLLCEGSSPLLCEGSTVIMLQSAKENCFNKQGFYAPAKLEHEHLILLAKVHSS